MKNVIWKCIARGFAVVSALTILSACASNGTFKNPSSANKFPPPAYMYK